MRRVMYVLGIAFILVVLVPSSALAGKTAPPPLPGIFEGQVIADVYETPVAGAQVTAYVYSKRSGWTPGTSCFTGSDGRYSLAIAAGTYRLGFSASGYDVEYHRNVSTIASATSESILAAGKRTVDASLRPFQDGTVANPYLVYDLASLNAVREHPAAVHAQVRDIDASPTGQVGSAWYRNGAGWEPIGTYAPYFSGTYDGRGHSISGLYSRNAAGGAGLFGTLQWATVKSLSLLGVDISASGYTGGIAGETAGGSGCFMSDVNVSGRVSGNGFTGGLVGLAWSGGSTTDCSVDAVIDDTNWGDNSAAGGLFGFVYHPNIQRCATSGSVRSDGAAAGFIGSAYSGSVYNSFSTADLIAADAAGGITASTWTSSSIHTVRNCYYAGTITGALPGVGGAIVGDVTKGPATVLLSYYDASRAGVADNGYGTPKTTGEMQDAATFADWDLASVWSPPVPGLSYPTLR